MASKVALKRLQKEYSDSLKSPVPLIQVAPESTNLLVWYFIFDGPPDTPYQGGEFVGRVQIPKEYPMKAPSFYMITPTGRFATETSICTTMSSWHQDQWSPSMSITSCLNGLLSVMMDESEQKAIGMIETELETKKSLAKSSLSFNVNSCPVFKRLFPKRYEEAVKKIALEREEKEKAEREKKEKEKAEKKEKEQKESAAGEKVPEAEGEQEKEEGAKPAEEEEKKSEQEAKAEAEERRRLAIEKLVWKN